MQLKKLPLCLLDEQRERIRVCNVPYVISMRCRTPITAVALLAGLLMTPVLGLAETSSSPNYKILAREDGGFNNAAVEKLIENGDKAIAKGNLAKARKHYDNARSVSKQLLSFYRDLGGAFRGLDARIPREMDKKGRETLTLLASANLRLAALFRRQNQPEVAVPVLVEVVRLMTPAKLEGQKAYQSLYELGFADTPYAGARKQY